jgi:hypothetical protein
VSVRAIFTILLLASLVFVAGAALRLLICIRSAFKDDAGDW